MLITKITDVKWNVANKNNYENKGYKFTKYKDNFKCKVEDLSKGSKSIIEVLCDYCLRDGIDTLIKKPYCEYVHSNLNSIIHTDCCAKCQSIKTLESNLITYGAPSATGLDEIQDKIKATHLKKYGFEWVMQSQEFKDKMRNTLYKKGLIACSKQQSYIHKLLGGELNFPVGYFNLDIAFPESKIYIEYNGNGHDLSVRMGTITEEEFKNKAIRRYNYLKSKGWKLININSFYDYLPSDDVLWEEFNKALEWLSIDGYNHSHYNIDIGKKKNDINFGKLRRLKKQC